VRIVIPSVRYADFLAVTLPAWRAFLPDAALTVVTAPGDRATIAIARAAGATVLVTDIWTRPVPVPHNPTDEPVVFNKAGALDEGFGFTGSRSPPALGEWCLALDSDLVPFGPWPTHLSKDLDTLYGCPRYVCKTPASLRSHQRGTRPRARLRLIEARPWFHHPYRATITGSPVNAARRCLGYFQLFRYRPGRQFGHSRTAARYDLDFHHHFARRVGLTDLYLLHLGSVGRDNWEGRTTATWT
jgi:hypothetical protein